MSNAQSANGEQTHIGPPDPPMCPHPGCEVPAFPLTNSWEHDHPIEVPKRPHEHDWVLVEAAALVTYYECRGEGCNFVREDRHGSLS